ncbi:MAG TPA: putative lipid II flippase FtsW [Anaeromyxobacteraceae bacterium]|nr:putative lipid II flippase FtsW [Anaeromyxobacteraceae bacterium]
MSEPQTSPRAAIANPGFDPWLLAAFLLLAGFGLVMVYSASAVMAGAKAHDEFFFLKRQLAACAIGMTLLAAVVAVGYRRLEGLAVPLLFAVFLALVAVLVPGLGRTSHGARRWLDLGLLAFQPAEAAKVALVLYLARSLARKKERVRIFSIGFLPHVVVTVALAGLVLKEKDLGTAVILAAVLFLMLFAAGVPLRYLLGTLAIAGAVGWLLIWTSPYRYERVLTFLDPFRYRDRGGFQMVESLLGIGSGGLAGLGLGQGKAKLFYLPEPHTDFIAAVVAEETGLVGSTVLILLFAVVVWRGFRAARRASDAFGCYLALGVTTLFGVQAIVNLAVVFGLLPTKGLTLPLVSYGGSSLITLLAAAGMLLSVSGSQGGFLGAPRAPRLAAAGATP